MQFIKESIFNLFYVLMSLAFVFWAISSPLEFIVVLAVLIIAANLEERFRVYKNGK